MFVKIKKNYFLLASTFLILYFFFNLLDGERGLFSYFEKKKLLSDLVKKETLLNKNILDIEFKNSLLTENLDLDFIEMLIRQKFLLGKKNETHYRIIENEK